jgi:hypothetical protein
MQQKEKALAKLLPGMGNTNNTAKNEGDFSTGFWFLQLQHSSKGEPEL